LIPAEPGRATCPKRRSSNANGLCGQKSARSAEILRDFQRDICHDISEFDSYMPSHAFGLSQVRSPTGIFEPKGGHDGDPD